MEERMLWSKTPQVLFVAEIFTSETSTRKCWSRGKASKTLSDKKLIDFSSSQLISAKKRMCSQTVNLIIGAIKCCLEWIVSGTRLTIVAYSIHPSLSIHAVHGQVRNCLHVVNSKNLIHTFFLSHGFHSPPPHHHHPISIQQLRASPDASPIRPYLCTLLLFT